MAARLDGEISVSTSGPLDESTKDRISPDSYERFLQFRSFPDLPASPGSAWLVDLPLGPTDPAANDKYLEDQERMVDGDGKNIYSSIPVLVTLTIALMIAIFIIGLDTNIIDEPFLFNVFPESRNVDVVVSCLKENTKSMTINRYRYTKDHEPFLQFERRRLI